MSETCIDLNASQDVEQDVAHTILYICSVIHLIFVYFSGQNLYLVELVIVSDLMQLTSRHWCVFKGATSQLCRELLVLTSKHRDY